MQAWAKDGTVKARAVMDATPYASERLQSSESSSRPGPERGFIRLNPAHRFATFETMRRAPRSLRFGVALALAGCEAQLRGPTVGDETGSSRAEDPERSRSGETERPPGPPFTCEDEVPWAPERLDRLTWWQLAQVITDLSDRFAPGADLAAVEGDFRAVPREITSTAADYRRMSQSVSRDHVDGWYRVAVGVAEAWTADGPEPLLGSCEAPDCLRSFVRELTSRAFRRPPSADELDFFVNTVHGAAPDDVEALRDVVVAALSAPPFLYRLELGRPDAGASELRRLTGHELAARLALHFWQGLPDDELLRAAEAGELDDEEKYRAQVERMVEDPRSRGAIEAFFEQWLQLDDLPPLDRNRDQPRFAAYAGEDLPSPELRDRLVREVLDLVAHYVYEVRDGTLADLFTSRRAFARTEDVARLYGGVPLWSPGGAPPALPAEERAGLLTRPGLLADPAPGTRPIIRGTRILRRVLCRDIQLPEDMEGIRPIDDGASGASTRERTEALTEQPGSRCAGCHGLINPVGFAFEAYDGLGRHRRFERIYDAEGRLVTEVPIDSRATPIVGSQGPTFVKDAVELSEVLADDPMVEACFVRQYFRFTFGEREDLERDACRLHRLWRVIDRGGSLRDVAVAIALEPAFRRVRKEAP